MAAPIAGVWTPWADVLCRVCHDALPEDVDARKPVKWPEGEKREGDGPGWCTKCGTAVWVASDIAQLTRLRKLTGGVLEQTGGMCAALTIGRLDGGTVVVSNMDGPLCIARYKAGEWEACGAEAQAYCIPGETPDQHAAFAIMTAVREKRND